MYLLCTSIPLSTRRASSIYHVLAVRTRADPPHLDANILLDKLYVLPCLCWQLLELLDVRCGRVPALELLVDDLAALEQRQVRGEEVQLLTRSRVLVGDGHLQGWERVENVELGQVQGGVVVDGLGGSW